MLTSGQLNRNQGIDKSTNYREATLEQVLNTLEIFRKCRLRRGGPVASDPFTLEDMVAQINEAWDHRTKIPHSIYGALAVQAVRRNILTHVGYGRASKDSSNHREVREYCWQNLDNIQPVKPCPANQ